MGVASCTLQARADGGSFKAHAVRCGQKLEGLRWSLTPQRSIPPNSSVPVSCSCCELPQAGAKTELNLVSGANSACLLLKACNFLAVPMQLLCGLNWLGKEAWGVCEGWGVQGY